MTELLQQLEQTGFCTWVRESTSLFAFPGFLLLHTIGMGIVVGISWGIALRILGFAPALPLAPMEKYFPVLWLGFWINAITGTVLLAADASTKLANPDFYVKMMFIVLAVINVRMIQKRVFGQPHVDKMPLSRDAKVLAAASLIFWLGAITSGRLLAYVGPVSGLQ